MKSERHKARGSPEIVAGHSWLVGGGLLSQKRLRRYVGTDTNKSTRLPGFTQRCRHKRLKSGLDKACKVLAGLCDPSPTPDFSSACSVLGCNMLRFFHRCVLCIYGCSQLQARQLGLLIMDADTPRPSPELGALLGRSKQTEALPASERVARA